MRVVLLALLAAGGLAGAADAQVFGLKGGQNLESLPSATPIEGEEPFQFTIVPPQPDAAFARYTASVYPEMGLCTVNAYLAPTQKTGVAGAQEAIGLHEALAAKLDKAYGPAVDEEFGDGSGDREKDIAEGLSNVVRAYGQDEHRLPKGIDRIALFLQAEGGVPQVFVSYDFPNQDACLDARNAAIDAAAAPQ